MPSATSSRPWSTEFSGEPIRSWPSVHDNAPAWRRSSTSRIVVHDGDEPRDVGRGVRRVEARDTDFTTMSGIPVDGVYGPDDGAFQVGLPTPAAPMHRCTARSLDDADVRGLRHHGRHRLAVQEIIKAGGDGLSTAFDMPTLLGIDSDDPMALGEVGRCGVAIDSLADMEDLYSAIDLGQITTSMTINSPAAVLLRDVRRSGRGRASIALGSAARCRTTS